MPSEYILKQRAKDFFIKKGYQVWFASPVKFKAESDIFSIWDGIAWKKNKFIFVQITTISNKKARLKKIVNFMLSRHLYFTKPVEGWLMCYRSKTKKFEIFKI